MVPNQYPYAAQIVKNAGVANFLRKTFPQAIKPINAVRNHAFAAPALELAKNLGTGAALTGGANVVNQMAGGEAMSGTEMALGTLAGAGAHRYGGTKVRGLMNKATLASVPANYVGARQTAQYGAVQGPEHLRRQMEAEKSKFMSSIGGHFAGAMESLKGIPAGLSDVIGRIFSSSGQGGKAPTYSSVTPQQRNEYIKRITGM